MYGAQADGHHDFSSKTNQASGTELAELRWDLGGIERAPGGPLKTI